MNEDEIFRILFDNFLNTKEELGLSNQDVATNMDVSRSTIGTFINQGKKNGLSIFKLIQLNTKGLGRTAVLTLEDGKEINFS